MYLSGFSTKKGLFFIHYGNDKLFISLQHYWRLAAKLKTCGFGFVANSYSIKTPAMAD
jgi:hypothetical protein